MEKIDPSEAQCRFALLSAKGIGPQGYDVLMERMGNATEIVHSDKKKLMMLGGLSSTLADSILQAAKSELPEFEKKWARMADLGIQIIFKDEPGFPFRLLQTSIPPVFIYFKGKCQWDQPRCLGIVGTRNPTSEGKRWLQMCMDQLKDHDITIYSGLARGIDSIAHQEALRLGMPTIAVMGHGLDWVYPSEHRNLANDMQKEGGLISQFHPGTPPDKNNFPERNVIVAGLVDGLLVVESGIKGGSMITARLAFEHNREVMAVPGFPGREASTGTNFLIKSLRASLVEKADDILELLGWTSFDRKSTPRQLSMLPPEDPNHAAIFALLKNQPATAELLMEWTEKPASLINRWLVELELLGYIQALPGKVYSLST